MNNKIRTLPINSWREGERPRERLLNKGSGSLSDAELLAIIMGTGSPGENAVDLARRILEEIPDGWRGLGRMTTSRLMAFKGVGPGKAAKMVALMEVGRRYVFSEVPKGNPIRQSRDAYLKVQPLFTNLMHEEFWVLYLNNANKVQFCFQLSKGGITGTLVDVRLMLKKALELGAVGLILAHNHPSGNLKPSKADLQITRKAKKAAAFMDIRILDHIIVHGGEYFSFADEQLL